MLRKRKGGAKARNFRVIRRPMTRGALERPNRQKTSQCCAVSPIFTHFHPFSFIFIHFHLFSPIYIHFHPFSSIFTHFHRFSSIFTHFHPFSPIFTHFQVAAKNRISNTHSHNSSPTFFFMHSSLTRCSLGLAAMQFEWLHS